ncbi:uncharacterized protein BO66DRAFT_111394 [Aspergillus aculeatinus CBS 121060]|uniref:Uncharacterized protein n=1 Tax=Aspergillus aculeatinus CBS 121060 TaxID=1448322 RepID=A0ACD1HLB8_9EURO|nr:hypothetical protein BO66DRAFT_111394 [Aspergillus aculeatinus CBS 121060]RAH74603.1 hypothetical protein BO66DRAFT_111394 [Aspergillus aculeatinus CBS 121060]
MFTSDNQGYIHPTERRNDSNIPIGCHQHCFTHHWRRRATQASRSISAPFQWETATSVDHGPAHSMTGQGQWNGFNCDSWPPARISLAGWYQRWGWVRDPMEGFFPNAGSGSVDAEVLTCSISLADFFRGLSTTGCVSFGPRTLVTSVSPGTRLELTGNAFPYVDLLVIYSLNSGSAR